MLDAGKCHVTEGSVGVLMLRSLNYRVSNAYRWAAGAEMVAHLFRGQMGCMKHRAH